MTSAQSVHATSWGLSKVDPKAPENRDSGELVALFTEVNALAIQLRRGRSRDRKVESLPGAEQAVLQIIDRFGPHTVPQIARLRLTSRQNIQILVDRLGRQGQVGLMNNPAHKRSALVRLTDQGKDMLHQVEESQKEPLDEIGSCLSEAEINSVIVLLRRIRSMVSGVKTPDDRTQETDGCSAEADSTQQSGSGSRVFEETATTDNEFPINLL